MQKFILIISFLTMVPAIAQDALLLEETAETYTDEAQLKAMYLRFNQSLLVIEDQIYLIPCDCAPCRYMGAGIEGRNSGGDQAGRSAGGDSDGRGMAGDMDGRNQGGDEAGRSIGGDTEGRNMDGGSEGRNSGGDGEGRNMGGDSDERGMGGDADGRGMGGDTDGRDMGGDGEGRNNGGDMAGRLAAGDTNSFACEKKSKSRFKLLNVNKNAQIFYYDGVELTKVSIKNGLIKY